ncbi:MAG TPA: baseplate J/gp47 family protein [Pyrinomonadaceae bacterium]|nr:baseplate J/gp47 family protein [Pyrinomonadaceae bacterium]
MPIKLPNLDDRTFADLVAEAHTLIPVHAPKWTNHNESDPGITLVELFAYLTEMQIYRLNRVTDANVCAFLRLIDGVERKPSTQNRGMVIRPENTEVALRDEVRDVVLKLRQQDRAVSCEDFERLSREADQKVSRAYCLPRTNLTANPRYAIAEGHVSVVIVPPQLSFDTVLWCEGNKFIPVTAATIPLWLPTTTKDHPFLYLGSSTVFESFSFNLAETGAGYSLKFEYFDGKNWTRLTNDTHRLADGTSNWTASGLVTFTRPPDWRQKVENDVSRYWLRISSTTGPTKRATANKIYRDLVERVSQYLEPRRLLTTRVHVVGPPLVTIGVHVNLSLKHDAVQETVKQEVRNRLRQFLNVAVWPFGRNVYVSEIYRQLDRIPGVDFVTKITGKEIVTAHGVEGDRQIKQGSELVAIKLNPDELVEFSLEKSDIEVLVVS